jgi:hypothetical protein
MRAVSPLAIQRREGGGAEERTIHAKLYRLTERRGEWFDMRKSRAFWLVVKLIARHPAEPRIKQRPGRKLEPGKPISQYTLYTRQYRKGLRVRELSLTEKLRRSAALRLARRARRSPVESPALGQA